MSTGDQVQPRPPAISAQTSVVFDFAALDELKADSTVNLDFLVKQGLVTSPKHPLKVLGNGNLKTKLIVQASSFTASARSKIEAAGGTCELLD